MEFSKKLHQIRKQKGWTLQELAKKSGVAIATLSRLEKGVHKGTFRTHQKICDALNIDIIDLYKGVESPEQEIDTSAADSEEIETFLYDDKASSVFLTHNALRKNMMPTLLFLEPGGKTHLERNPKGTEKFLFCMEGNLNVIIGEKNFNLGPNGVMYFKSSVLHEFKNSGKNKVKCLCITSPAVL